MGSELFFYGLGELGWLVVVVLEVLEVLEMSTSVRAVPWTEDEQ